jgi:hypothetical protein
MKRRITPPVYDSLLSTIRDAVIPNSLDCSAYKAATRISGDCVVASHHRSLKSLYDYSSNCRVTLVMNRIVSKNSSASGAEMKCISL